LVDFIGVERSRSNTDAGNPQADEEQPLFHLLSDWFWNGKPSYCCESYPLRVRM
jgi:hypothetical protein